MAPKRSCSVICTALSGAAPAMHGALRHGLRDAVRTATASTRCPCHRASRRRAAAPPRRPACRARQHPRCPCHQAQGRHSVSAVSPVLRPAGRTVVGRFQVMSSGCMPPCNAWASRASSGPGGATGIGSSSRGTESALPLPTVMDVTEQPSSMTSNLAKRMAQPLPECAPRRRPSERAPHSCPRPRGP